MLTFLFHLQVNCRISFDQECSPIIPCGIEGRKSDKGLYNICYSRGRFIISVFQMTASHDYRSLVAYSVLAIFPTRILMTGGATLTFRNEILR